MVDMMRWVAGEFLDFAISFARWLDAFSRKDREARFGVRITDTNRHELKQILA